MKRLRLLIAVLLATTVLVAGPVAPVTAQAAQTVKVSAAALKSSVKVDKKAKLVIDPVTYGKKRVAVATFSKAVKGRPVSLQLKQGKKWKQVATAEMDKKGRASFTVSKIGTGTYRAVADKTKVKKKTVAAAASPSVEGGSQWKRTFRDGFGGRELSSKWTTRAPGRFSGGRACAASDPSMVEVKNHTAVLSIRRLDPKSKADKAMIAAANKVAKKVQKAKRDAAIKAAKKLKGDAKKKALKAAEAMETKGCVNGVFLNGIVDTSTSFSMPSGIVAARVKFPKGQGFHGSVWLQTTRSGSAKPRGTEIDIVESFGYGKGVINFLHSDEKKNGTLVGSGAYVLASKTKDPKWWDKYHVYSVEWSGKTYIYRIDGVETMRLSKSNVKGDRQQLIMSLLSSDWELPLLTNPVSMSGSGVKASTVKKANVSKSKVYVAWVEAWEKA
ncbi:MAG: family 16 glycosylhydrolase [Tessaracoccus sp.]|uniref:glycoside hydrolase family 16 protein n=1 Tax=Tessaracoccus sp. TaxID=1971211 RepID=UPI001ED309E8|nr:family 16 glycosylhydrolase [Tessaracoccus sp.]MBK7820157.1 family 16 glycosylhydrolase [Tessaracoccus sp.]